MTDPQRYPTTDELDYERRKAAGFPGLGIPARQSRGVVGELQTQFAVEGNDTSGYIGVTSDRMTYANETERPLAAGEGVEADRERRLLDQEFLVSPEEPSPEGKQTGGGGSTQESVVTALSGENLSSQVANPPTTEKTEDGSEQGVPAGSSGVTVSEAEKAKLDSDSKKVAGVKTPPTT